MIKRRFIGACFAVLTGISFFVTVQAHDMGEARYIANEAVMVRSGDVKVLFDPLPLTGFGTYPDVPEKDRDAMMKGIAPFDSVDAVFISHAHRDHFSAEAMNAYLAARQDTQLVAPHQAIELMRLAPDWDKTFLTRIHAVELGFGDAARSFEIGDIKVGAVRIPHSGWPQRADVENIVFRVELGKDLVVAHMGDADIDITHYQPYAEYWQAKKTDLAFPPYWIYLYPDGQDILDVMNVQESVGIHVPIKVPADLKASGADYFSVNGETRPIKDKDAKACSPLVFDSADFTVCEFSAADDIRLVWGKDDETPYGDFDGLAEHLESQGQTLSFAMNGGMYHPDRRPVGYYLEDGRKRQNLQTKASTGNFGLFPNGVFQLGDGSVNVTETKSFAIKDMDVVSATQSGPMLVIDGKLHPKFRQNSDSKKRRNGVGVFGDKVYFAISEEPVNFHHFGRLFRDHLKTPNALYLDGVVSRLYDEASGRNDPGMPMGPIIAVVTQD